jgi:hypothetical protein
LPRPYLHLLDLPQLLPELQRVPLVPLVLVDYLPPTDL